MSAIDFSRPDVAALAAQFATTTGISVEELRRVMALPTDAREAALACYASADWADPGTPAGKTALTIATALLTAAGGIATIGGAVSAVAALEAL